MSAKEDLHVKYRPAALDDVVGHTTEIKSLNRLKKKGMPHTFLFSGPSGVGKTTLARIVADMVRAERIEIDAATFSGVGEIKSIAENLRYRSLQGSGAKCAIIDEAHSLSRQAWQSLLKIIEEPPAHVFFCFCTTEADKVPKTIQTRAHTYNLKPLAVDDVQALVESVAEEEGIELDEDSLRLIARKSEGSARSALVHLSMAAGAKDAREVKRLVEQAGDEAEQVELFRLLVTGNATWKKAVELLNKMEISSYESLRIGLVNYAAVVVARSKKEPTKQLALLEAFRGPFNRSTEKADFLLALGEYLL